MNFKKWYLNFDETNDVATAENGWNACKQEVLKILKDARFNNLSWVDTPEEVEKEIKNYEIQKFI